MRLPCLVRLGYDGPVIKDIYDTDTGTTRLVPDELLTVKLTDNVKRFLSSIRVEKVPFTSETFNAMCEWMSLAPRTLFCFADMGNHIYYYDNSKLSIKSIKTDEGKGVIIGTQNVFSKCKYANVGPLRMKPLTVDYHFNMARLIVFDVNGTKVFFNGKRFEVVSFNYDEPSSYSPLALARNEDPNVFAAVREKGTDILLRY